MAGTVTASTERALDERSSATASRVFDDTPLEGARITGRLAGVIDTYGGYVVDAYRSNEEFYDAARDDLEVAWAEREEADHALAAARQAMMPGDQGGPSDDATRATTPSATTPGPTTPSATTPSATTPGSGPADGAGQQASDGEGPAAPDAQQDGSQQEEQDQQDEQDEQDERDEQGGGQEEQEEDAEREEDGDAAEPVVLLVVSDLHCNVGMARVIRAAAELSGARVVLNAGDTTVNGTAVEEYCVDAFADAVPDGVDLVVADGNHDSDQTSAQERQSGATVLDGEVVEVAGLRILGDSDPNATRIGVGTVPVGEESIGAAARRIADLACDDGDVDLLLVHNPNVGNLALDEGCVPAQVSGHQHRRLGPVRFGQGVRYVNSSTAGAAHGQATIGPLNGVAEMTVLRWDPETRSMLDHRLVRVSPDGSVDVGFAIRWPGAPAPDAPRGAVR
ncbi:metallophosphoesterase [Actinotalea ferrariae]|nr:metallophosphoesterase [Actinotalea ferrariae]